MRRFMKPVLKRIIVTIIGLSAVQLFGQTPRIPLAGWDVLHINQGGERFAPLSVASGQGLRTVVANVRVPATGKPTTACPVVVRFFDFTGALIGAEHDFPLAPGASMAVTAPGATGLVRVIVSVSGLTDPMSLCALKSGVELFDSSTAKTLILVEGQACVGAARCASPLMPPAPPEGQ